MRITYLLSLIFLIITISCDKDEPDPILPIDQDDNPSEEPYVYPHIVIADSLLGYYVGESFDLGFAEGNRPTSDGAVYGKLFYDIQFLNDSMGVRHFSNSTQEFRWYLEKYIRILNLGVWGIAKVPEQNLHIIDTVERIHPLGVVGSYFNDSGGELLILINDSTNNLLCYYDSILTNYSKYELLGVGEVFKRRK